MSDFITAEDLTAYATEAELSAYATKAELTGYVENGDLTAYYTKSETSSATELADAFAGAGGAISAFDMSENPVMSKALVREAVDNGIFLPDTVVQYTDETIAVRDINLSGLGGTPKYIAIGTEKTTLSKKDLFNYKSNFKIKFPDSFSGIRDTMFYTANSAVLDFGNTRTTIPLCMSGSF